jgi:glycosyltransferase 2 family protein
LASTATRALRALIGAVVIGFALWTLSRQWDEVRAQGVAWQLSPAWIAASLLLTWVMYLLLVGGWRALIVSWGERLAFWPGVRIWLLAGLGKYVIGKVWSLLGMAVLAEREGVRGPVAMASSVVMQLLALATGAAVAIAALGGPVLDRAVPLGQAGAIGLGLLTLASAALVTHDPTMQWLGQRLGRPDAVRSVRLAEFGLAALPNLVAWLGYGIALVWLAQGTLGGVALEPTLAIGAFAASYLAGYLFVLAPGGVGVRESVLVLLLQDAIGVGNALALAAVSRLALTVNELGVALPLLLLRRSSRDDA